MRGASVRTIERGLSRTTNSTGIAASRSMAPPARKIARSPMKVVASPPAAGPTALPSEIAELKIPNPQARCAAGVSVATSAVAAATVPELAPWMPRSTVSCSADWLRPIRPTEMPPPIIARINIGFRP